MEQEKLLGKNCFNSNQEITEYMIPEGIKRIGESCFENCINLRKVVISDSVVGIHKRAFFGCENLEEIKLSENIQYIPEEMFSGCVRLKRIVLPKTIKMISNNAFAGCCSLEEVVIPNEEVKIANTAFEGCTALKFDNAVAIASHFIKPLSVLIHNKANGIGERFRTFAARDFLFDGVECASIGSVLEAFKFADIDKQEEIASMPAWDAYHEGQTEEAVQWQMSRILHWNGTEYHRDEPDYQALLRRLFYSVFEQDAQFRLDVAFLKNASLSSKICGANPQNQVLTKKEYLENLLAFSGGSYTPAEPTERHSVEAKPIVRNQEAMEHKRQKTQKIVVLGGSFNPPTLAHEKILIGAVNQLSADLGIFVPSSDAYVRRKMSKQENGFVLSENQRLKLLQTICKADDRLIVSTCEFSDDGRGHTFDTLQKIQAEYPDALLYFLIGADKLKVIPRWHRGKQFFETFDFAVICRNVTNPSDAIRKNSYLNAYEDIFHLIAEPEGISEISSTLVRNLLQKGDRTAESLLSANVYDEVFKMLQQKNIDSFRGDYDFLSNFYEAVINYQGIQYLNNESAFQAQKCLEESEKMEFSYLSAGKAKRKGRQIKLRPDWEQVKVPIMEEIVRAKFSQNPQLAEKLIATADRKIVEGNTWNDIFWGVDAATGKGENHLGEILMKIRGELISGK